MGDKLADDPAWAAELAYQAEGCHFTAAVGIRRTGGGNEPLAPLHSKALRNLPSTKDGLGYARWYTAVPGHEFVLKVKQVVTAPTSEYGLYVFLTSLEGSLSLLSILLLIIITMLRTD